MAPGHGANVNAVHFSSGNPYQDRSQAETYAQDCRARGIAVSVTPHPQGGFVVQTWHHQAPPQHHQATHQHPTHVEPWRPQAGYPTYTPSQKARYLNPPTKAVIALATVLGLLLGSAFGAAAPHMDVAPPHAAGAAAFFALIIVGGGGLAARVKPGKLFWGVVHALLAAAVAPFLI